MFCYATLSIIGLYVDGFITHSVHLLYTGQNNKKYPGSQNSKELAATLWWFTAAPKPPKNTSFLGVTQTPGVAQPYF